VSDARSPLNYMTSAHLEFSIDIVSVLEPKKRFVSKMIFNNFKSYFGKQEIGPFHKSFSA
ncbi:11339_t:CDS:2, partial [Funneliformis mosseae]